MVCEGGKVDAYGSLPSERRTQEPQAASKTGTYVRLAGITLAAVAFCGVAMYGMHEGSSVVLLKGDAESQASKILASQHFRKANQEQRVEAVQHILGKGAKDSSGSQLIAKIAKVVADKHETYHQRMEAMRELLDSQTDSLKHKGLVLPKHAAAKSATRGRKQESHADKAAKEAEDNAKAIADGEKLIHETKQPHGEKRLHLDAQDKKIKEEFEHAKADPKVMAKWMKKEAAQSKAKAAKSVQDKHSAKKVAEKTIAAKKHVTVAAAAAVASDDIPKGDNWQKLVQWAEGHGLPSKLANNPNDKAKVKDIIARMKADAMVEKIQAQFKHDDNMVQDVVHSADPGAAGVI